MASRLPLFLTTALLTGAALALAADAPFRATHTDRGTSVEMSIENASGATLPLREEEPARFRVALQDVTTRAKLSGTYPSVWIVSHAAGDADERRRCTAEVASLLTGSIGARAALDLNIFYVLALNGDGTITIVDPRFGFGGTQLLGMLQLEHAGYDWALGDANRRLFVSVPESNRVAVIDTVRWKETGSIDAGPNPRRVLVSPDGAQLYVTNDSGVAVIRASDATRVANIATGRGAHDVALSDDARFLIVTNLDDANAAIIDAHANAVIARIDSGASPRSVVFSTLSGMAYVAGDDGTITVIDPKRRKAIATMSARAGLTQLRVAPGGRFAFAPNPVKNVVQIIDTASNRIVQTAEISSGPFDIAFSDDLAYVRRLQSETVQMIPLAAIGKEGTAVPVVDFPAGEQPFGDAARATGGAGIVSAPAENAVIIANPADKQVYYYKEGMAAPIGHFSNYGHSPRAVLVLDRSMKETHGAYTTTAVLPDAGDYDVAVFLDAPRVVTCFPLTITENPALNAQKRRMPVTIEQLTTDRVIATGKPAHLSFRLNDRITKQPRADIADAMVLIVHAGGSWLNREPLHGETAGLYAADFTPPQPGVYYVYVGAPSIGLRTNNPQFLVLEAR
jgi:DNA-binding beta-propeller fold protein YncE